MSYLVLIKDRWDGFTLSKIIDGNITGDILEQQDNDVISILRDFDINRFCAPKQGSTEGKIKYYTDELMNGKMPDLRNELNERSVDNTVDTSEQVVNFFENTLLGHLREGENVLVMTQGLSLRLLIGCIEHLTLEEKLNSATPRWRISAYKFDINGKVSLAAKYLPEFL